MPRQPRFDLSQCTERLRESMFSLPKRNAYVTRSTQFTGLIDGIAEVSIGGPTYRYEMYEGEPTGEGSEFAAWLEHVARPVASEARQ